MPRPFSFIRRLFDARALFLLLTGAAEEAFDATPDPR